MFSSPHETEMKARPLEMSWKLWIYTNYDCNLSCAYCAAESTPRTPRRALPLETIRRLVDEAVAAGFQEIFFTGGEPLILPEIYAMLRYSAEQVRTTLLTNAMLVRGKRLENLREVARHVPEDHLIVQVSLDGGRAEHHEAYRGPGSWAPAVAGIVALLDNGFQVRLGTTETPANADYLDEICAFHESLGIPHEHHFVRPLARRGFSQEGLRVDKTNLAPELTVNVDGVFWHPLSTDPDMQVSRSIFPLGEILDCVRDQASRLSRGEELSRFT